MTLLWSVDHQRFGTKQSLCFGLRHHTVSRQNLKFNHQMSLLLSNGVLWTIMVTGMSEYQFHFKATSVWEKWCLVYTGMSCPFIHLTIPTNFKQTLLILVTIQGRVSWLFYILMVLLYGLTKVHTMLPARLCFTESVIQDLLFYHSFLNILYYELIFYHSVKVWHRSSGGHQSIAFFGIPTEFCHTISGKWKIRQLSI